MEEMGVGERLLEWTPFAAMIMVECLDVGLSTLGKAAMDTGMNHFVFVVYSNALATLMLLPLAFFINRSSLVTFFLSSTLTSFTTSTFQITHIVLTFDFSTLQNHKSAPFFRSSLQVLPPGRSWVCMFVSM